jgi:DNA modification methylase
VNLSPYWSDGTVSLHLGDCLEVLAEMEAGSVDAVVTDPPAGIAFMDREWDDFRRARNSADAGRDNVFGRTSARGPEYGRGDRAQFVRMLTERMTEAYRVLKPGGHALVWAIPRTSHWTAWALEDAGFDIRDCVLHLFGSGFAKGRDLHRLDILPEVEQQLREQGVTGEITWR